MLHRRDRTCILKSTPPYPSHWHIGGLGLLFLLPHETICSIWERVRVGGRGSHTFCSKSLLSTWASYSATVASRRSFVREIICKLTSKLALHVLNNDLIFFSPPATARMNSPYLSESSQLISSSLCICLMQPLLAEGPLELPKSLHGASTAQDRRATDSYHLRGGGIFSSTVSTHNQCFAAPSITLGNNRDACDAPVHALSVSE
jgi:hypothetical protein